MKRMLLMCGLGVLLVSGGSIYSTPSQSVDIQELLTESGLRFVDQNRVQAESLVAAQSMLFFYTVRYASIAILVGSAGYGFYNWYTGVQSRSVNERLDALEAANKKNTSTSVPEAGNGWLNSFYSFGKSVVAGVPTQIGSTVVTTATLGLLTSTIPVAELAKPEPSYKWFLGYKTGFANQCSLLMIYLERQVAHEAFCLETVRLVSEVEKILGYIAYQIKKLKNSSAMTAQVLESRSAQLITMTNQLVGLVAAQVKDDEKIGLSIQYLSAFVNDALPAGIFA